MPADSRQSQLFTRGNNWPRSPGRLVYVRYAGVAVDVYFAGSTTVGAYHGAEPVAPRGVAACRQPVQTLCWLARLLFLVAALGDHDTEYRRGNRAARGWMQCPFNSTTVSLYWPDLGSQPWLSLKDCTSAAKVLSFLLVMG